MKTMVKKHLRGGSTVRGSEKGIVLVVTLLVMLLLSLQGLAFLAISATESTIASNGVNSSQAFHLADAGVEHARRALINLSPSDVLDGTTDLFVGGDTANLGSGSYTVQVTNNIAANGFPRGTIASDPISGSCNPTLTKDCDRILVVTSRGSFQGSQRSVEAIIQVPALASGAVYVMDGPDAAGPAEIEDFEPATGSSISGIDCNPPSAGGGAGPGPHVPGIAVQGANAYNDLVLDLGAELPFVTGVYGAGDVQIVPDAMSDGDFDAWVRTLIATATDVGTGTCGGVNPNEFGSWANPQICHVQTSASDPLDSLIPDGSTGAGILIVNDLDPNALADTSSVRDFTYEGIIIVVGDGRFRLRGSSRIYGAVIQKNIDGSHSGETRLRVRDDSQICYSSLAVRAVQDTLTPSLMAWYDK